MLRPRLQPNLSCSRVSLLPTSHQTLFFENNSTSHHSSARGFRGHSSIMYYLLSGHERGLPCVDRQQLHVKMQPTPWKEERVSLSHLLAPLWMAPTAQQDTGINEIPVWMHGSSSSPSSRFFQRSQRPRIGESSRSLLGQEIHRQNQIHHKPQTPTPSSSPSSWGTSSARGALIHRPLWPGCRSKKSFPTVSSPSAAACLPACE